MAEEFGRLEARAGTPDDTAFDADPLMGRLRNLYNDAASEPLPEFMIKLLEKLDEAERRR